MLRYAIAVFTCFTLAIIPSALACPFCGSQGQTFVGEVNTADLIILVKPTNPKPDKDDYTRGTTDLIIKSIVKDHPYLAGKKQITINRLIPTTNGSDDRLLVFAFVEPKPAPFQAAIGGIVNGVITDSPIDAYRGVEISAESKLADYLKGAIAVREKDNVTRLKYFFNYLDATELEITSDAFMEFGNADYADVRKMAQEVSRDRVFGWLKDPATLSSRFGLYGLLAGHCGKKEDAEFMRSFLDDPKRRFQSGLDGLLAGYILLDQKNGWEYMTSLISNPDRQDFATQVAIVKVMRYFWDYRLDVIGKQQLVETMLKSVQNGDFADFAIDDLRKWAQFEKTAELLKICSQESHKKEPMVKRQLLKFMIASAQEAKSPVAIQFVADARKENPILVKEYEEIIETEKKDAVKTIEKK